MIYVSISYKAPFINVCCCFHACSGVVLDFLWYLSDISILLLNSRVKSAKHKAVQKFVHSMEICTNDEYQRSPCFSTRSVLFNVSIEARISVFGVSDHFRFTHTYLAEGTC